MQNREISQQEQNLPGTDNHVCSPFTKAHDTHVLNSATDDYENAAINPNNQPGLAPCILQTAPIALDNSEANENHLLKNLPPIANLNIPSHSITAQSEYCAQNFAHVSITERLFSKPMTENKFIIQTPNQACHDTQNEQNAQN